MLISKHGSGGRHGNIHLKVSLIFRLLFGHLYKKGKMKKYKNDFYEFIRMGAMASAEEVVPLLLEKIEPKSVVEIGCAG